MMYLKLILVFVVITLSISTVVAQTEDCPFVPDGLVNITSLEWDTPNESIRVRVGNGHQSEYLQTTLKWDVFSGTLEAVANERTVDALRLVDRLNIEDSFFAENNASYLSLSTIPESDYVLYIAETPRKTVVSVNTGTLETIELGQVTENLFDLDVIWYATDKAIVVVEPIYGSGFYSYDVCLDGSCFINLSQLLGYSDAAPAERPALNPQHSLLAAYNVASSTVSIVDLESRALQREYPVAHLLLGNTNPIWSEDEQSIYFWGFDDSRTEFVVYSLDLSSGITEVVMNMGEDSYGEYIDRWLIMPDEKILIWSNRDLHIRCYE
jgi:hypothetical protein